MESETAPLARVSRGGDEEIQYFIPRAPEEIWQAVVANPSVLALQEGGTVLVPTNSRGMHSFAAEPTATGFRLHATSAAAGSTTTGFAGAIFLEATLCANENGSYVDITFRRGWPIWARMRALGTTLSLGLGLAWAFLGTGDLVGRGWLVGLFAALVAPALWRDLSTFGAGKAKRDALRQLIQTVLGPLSLPEDSQSRSPYRQRRMALQGAQQSETTVDDGDEA